MTWRALYISPLPEGPWRAGAFAHLGLCYRAGGDAMRSNKCLARALALDLAESTAGPAACEAAAVAASAKDGDGSTAALAAEVGALCRAALAGNTRCLWAAVRLAPIAADAGEHEEAAAALQAVLRASPNAAAAWEALGAAYHALNRHSAAGATAGTYPKS